MEKVIVILALRQRFLDKITIPSIFVVDNSIELW